jgi:hypothetical protein
MPKVDMTAPLRPRRSLDIVDETDFAWDSAQAFLEEELARSDERREAGIPTSAEHGDLDSLLDRS